MAKPVVLMFSAIDKASQVIDKLQAKISSLGQSVNKVGAIDPGKSLRKTETRLNKLASTAQGVGAAMTASLTLPAAMMGKSLVTSGADFELAMADLQGRIDGLKPGQLDLLGEKARKLGVDMGVGSKGSIEAMTELAKAGASFDDIMNGAAETALKLGKAENISTEAAAGLLSNTLTVFNKDFKEATKVGDMLGKASGISSISIVDLENTMRHAALAASNYGISLESVAAATASLGKLGIKGEMGGTSLRSLINTIGGDASKQAKLVQAGASKSDFFNTDGTMKNIQEVLKSINKLNLSAVQFTEIFGKEFGSTIRKASTATALLDDHLQQITNSSNGYLDVLAKLKMDTFWGQWEKMKAAFADIGNAMAKDGTLAMLTDFIEGITKLIQGFNNLDPVIKKVVVAVGAFAAVAGPILFGIGTMVNGWMALGPVLTGIGAIFGAITLPITLWAGAIAGAIFLGYKFVKNWDNIKAGMKIVWGDAKAWVKDFFDFSNFGLDKMLKKLGMIAHIMTGGPIRNGISNVIEGTKKFFKGEQSTERFETKIPDTEEQRLAKVLRPEEFMTNRRKPKVEVDFKNVPFGTSIKEAQTWGKAEVDLDIGYAKKLSNGKGK